jgi:hypothetical protein
MSAMQTRRLPAVAPIDLSAEGDRFLKTFSAIAAKHRYLVVRKIMTTSNNTN